MLDIAPQPFQMADQSISSVRYRGKVDAPEADTGGMRYYFCDHLFADAAAPVGLSDTDILEVQIIIGDSVVDHPEHLD